MGQGELGEVKQGAGGQGPGEATGAPGFVYKNRFARVAG